MGAHLLAIEHSYSHCAPGCSHACDKAPLASMWVPPKKKVSGQLLSPQTWPSSSTKNVMKYAVLSRDCEVMFRLVVPIVLRDCCQQLLLELANISQL